MTMPRTFVIDKKFAQLMKVSLVIFLAFAALGIALPFLPDDSATTGCSQPPSPMRTYIVTAICTLIFGGFAWFSGRTLMALPKQSVTADDEGVWFARLDRDAAIVRWRDVAGLKEHPVLQRLDLLNARGEVMLKLEYQLGQFSELRALVIERTGKQIVVPPLPITTNKPWIYHPFYAAAVLGFSILGWKIGPESPWLGYLGMSILVAAIAREYLTAPWRVVIERDFLSIDFPTVRRRYPWPDIESIQLADFVDQNGVMHPQVQVTVRGGVKPFRLSGLGMDAIVMHRAMVSALNGECTTPNPAVQGTLRDKAAQHP